VASRLDTLGYGELEHDWDDVGRRRDKFVKTTVGSENHNEQQLTGMIQDLKKDLAENRMELERLRKDQVSYWRGSGCVARTPGKAYAEPARPAQFLDHQFVDMSVRSWRAPPTPPAPPSVLFTGVNMSSPPQAVYIRRHTSTVLCLPVSTWNGRTSRSVQSTVWTCAETSTERQLLLLSSAWSLQGRMSSALAEGSRSISPKVRYENLLTYLRGWPR